MVLKLQTFNSVWNLSSRLPSNKILYVTSLFKNSHLMALGYLKDLFVGNAKHINITKKNTIFDVWLEKGYIICEILSIKRID